MNNLDEHCFEYTNLSSEATGLPDCICIDSEFPYQTTMIKYYLKYIRKGDYIFFTIHRGSFGERLIIETSSRVEIHSWIMKVLINFIEIDAKNLINFCENGYAWEIDIFRKWEDERIKLIKSLVEKFNPDKTSKL